MTARVTMDPERLVPNRPAGFGEAWWKHGVVYQVYPRSFADSNGDGVGDLTGLIDHLDYLGPGPGGLGVDAIWLSPIYPSPGLDAGYDISDHRAVDPLFGTLADFARLVDDAHRRGIRIILDLVLNHTSDLHPWFISSRTDRAGPHSDWYIWRDPAGTDRAGRPRPPNNWLSFFGGSAWAFDAGRGQYYLHTFLPEQPDLDWRVPGVRQAQHEVIRTWLDRGVDGFRLDVFNTLAKDPELRSNPIRRWQRRPWDRQEHRFDKDQLALHELLDEIRAIVDARPGRMTVGELFEGGPELAAEHVTDRHLVFDFELIEQPWSATRFAEAIRDRIAAFGVDRWPTAVLSNHDRSRTASRITPADANPDEVARAAAVLLLTQRGTAFLYYGEELGMRDVAIPWDEIQDPPAKRTDISFTWWNRDQCRTPMPWSSEPGAGFSTGQPWLRLGPDVATRNVEAQESDPDSILALYRRLIAVRRTSPALHAGDLELLPHPNPRVLAYARRSGTDLALVVVNFGRRGAHVRLTTGLAGGWDAVVATHLDRPAGFRDGATVHLRPLEAAVFVPSTSA
jgi:alpha-glucosidase